MIHDVNPSQLGEAQWCISPISWLREALLAARRGPVVHRATNTLQNCRAATPPTKESNERSVGIATRRDSE